MAWLPQPGGNTLHNNCLCELPESYGQCPFFLGSNSFSGGLGRDLAVGCVDFLPFFLETRNILYCVFLSTE